MRPLIIAETVTLDTITLLSAELFDEQGRLLQPIIAPITNVADCVEAMKSFALAHDIYTFDVHTADSGIYIRCASEPGISAYIQHPSDTAHVVRTIERERGIFVELYEPTPEPVEVAPVLPELPAWRVFIAKHLRKLLKQIEGDLYEIY